MVHLCGKGVCNLSGGLLGSLALPSAEDEPVLADLEVLAVGELVSRVFLGGGLFAGGARLAWGLDSHALREERRVLSGSLSCKRLIFARGFYVLVHAVLLFIKLVARENN